MIKWPALLLSALILFTACKSTKKAEGSGTANNAMITSETARKPIIDKELYRMTRETLSLDSVYISGNTLHLITKKIQNCDADNFKLVWNGAMMKSLPPQTGIKLLLTPDPACKEQHPFHLQFDITSLRIKNVSGSTIIHINSWKNDILYKF